MNKRKKIPVLYKVEDIDEENDRCALIVKDIKYTKNLFANDKCKFINILNNDKIDRKFINILFEILHASSISTISGKLIPSFSMASHQKTQEKYNLYAKTVGIQLKTDKFIKYSHQKTLDVPTNSTQEIYITCKELLEKIDDAKIQIKAKLEIKTDLTLNSSEATNIN